MSLIKKLASYKTKEYIHDEHFDVISCCKYEGVNESKCILSIIQKYFPNIIELNKNEYRIPCIEKINSTDFEIIDNKINLSYISKCDVISGSDILLKIIDLARELKIKYINLQDASVIKIENNNVDPTDSKTIECEYSLSKYSILINGISWYNKYKFFSDNHSENVKHNNIKRNLPFRIFMKEAIHNYDMEQKDLTKDNIKSFKRIMINFIRYFPDINIDTPIKLIFRYINCYLKDNNGKLKCSDPKLKLILEIIWLSDYVLEYNIFLTWTNSE